MGELFGAALDIIAIFGLDGILDGTGSGIVDAQDGTLHQLDLTSSITSQAATLAVQTPSRGTTGSLSLPPGFCGGSLTACIRGSHTTGNTKRSGRVLHGLARVNGTCIGVMLSGIMSIAFGQAVAGTRSHRRDVSLVNIIERALTGQ